MGEKHDAPPLWVYGENGIEVPLQPLGDITTEVGGEEFRRLSNGAEFEVSIDKKTLRKIKWIFLKSAIKFFFTRDTR